jgi:ubiquinone/menaquinone biosynthesis C-methylase UbiE
MTEYLQAKYNLEDPTLVSIIDDLQFWSAPFGLKLLETVHYRKNMCALDIACGLGFPLVELAMRLGSSSKVFGIDPWKAGIERALLKLKLTGIDNVELVEGVAEKMPFDDHTFDLIISNNGINNVQDLSKTLMECNRVSKIGSQFVFTFNTEKTFNEFYSVYREVLRENDLQAYEKKIDDHIYSKRKPLSEFKEVLKVSGFRVNAVYEDEFSYHFSDGSAMLNHFFIKLAFMGPWKEILPENLQSRIFKSIEEKINRVAEKKNGFSMRVPFVTMDCEKVKEMK